MYEPDAHLITNDYHRFRLVSLRTWAGAAGFIARDHAGPYLVSQIGYAPGDLTMTPDEFLLGRSGEWVPAAGFFLLPAEVRRRGFLYGTVAELMEVLRSLPPQASVMRARAADHGSPAADAACEDLRAVFSQIPRETLPDNPPAAQSVPSG